MRGVFTRLKGRIADVRAGFRQPVDPVHQSAMTWARRRTALLITSPAFVVLEFATTPAVGLLVTPLAGALTALGLVVSTFLGSLIAAPLAQRNALRGQIQGRAGDLDFTHQLEHVRWTFRLPRGSHGRIFDVHSQAVAWLWVKNNGPTASFAAEVKDVTGLPSDWGDYFVAEAAWDQKNCATVEIPHGGRRKLKLAIVARSPQRCFWFWTTEGQVEAPGWQWWMGDDEVGEIQFTVVLTNTSSDQITTCDAQISIPRDVADSTFVLRSE